MKTKLSQVRTGPTNTKLRHVSKVFTTHLLPLLLLALPALAQAQFTYVTNNGTLTITRYTGPGGALDIPDMLDGRLVTAIGPNAFSSLTNLTRVRIPEGLITIEGGAFYYCTGMTSVTIASTVGNIGGMAFFSCLSLTNLTLPAGLTNLGAKAFRNCISLTNATLLGNKLTSIEDETFYNCPKLTTTALSGSLTNIGTLAFAYCSNLAGVTFGSNLTRIGDHAFFHCINLASVTIPASLTNLGITVFEYCPSLTAITVDTNNPVYSSLDGVLFDKAQTRLIEWPGGKAGSYTTPDSVTSIGHGAFVGAGFLTNLIVGSGVTNLGAYAFYYCGSLRTLTLSESITNIGDQTFFMCSNLVRLYFKGDAPTQIGSWAFFFCSPTVYYLPDTTGWGPRFQGCPTAVWQPQVLSTDPNFGVRTSQFGFGMTWAGGRVAVIEAATNFAIPAWLPVATNTFQTGMDPRFDGWSYFADPEWANHPARFYRLRAP